jgi:hypothetical protein
MIGVIWSLLTGNRLVRAVGAALVAVAGVLTFGALKRREGAQAARADAAVKAAKADKQAHERMNDADLGIGATDGERIGRLRDFAAKHGNRQTKGPGGGLR